MEENLFFHVLAPLAVVAISQSCRARFASAALAVTMQMNSAEMYALGLRGRRWKRNTRGTRRGHAPGAALPRAAGGAVPRLRDRAATAARPRRERTEKRFSLQIPWGSQFRCPSG